MPLTHVTTSNAAWRTLLDQWAHLLDQYERAAVPAGPDVAYWHTEQTLTALLASATWQVEGGVALLEFVTERIYPNPEDSWTGTGDAWLRVGGAWYTVEAKICWTASDVVARLREARDQLRALTPRDRSGTTCLAVCYCVPAVAATRPTQDVWAQTANEIRERVPRSMFRVEYRGVGEALTHDGYRYPGMVAVAVDESSPDLTEA